MIAASEKNTEKQDYWKTELRSLGLDPKKTTELNDKNELKALTENLKQAYYQDYKTAYGGPD